MSSWDEDPFRITGPLWGESSDHWWVPPMKDQSIALLMSSLNKVSSCLWFETKWRSCAVTVINVPSSMYGHKIIEWSIRKQSKCRCFCPGTVCHPSNKQQMSEVVLLIPRPPWTKGPPFRQTTFSNEFSWMKMVEFRFKLHWNLFPGVQLAISQHWLGDKPLPKPIMTQFTDAYMWH